MGPETLGRPHAKGMMCEESKKGEGEVDGGMERRRRMGRGRYGVA